MIPLTEFLDFCEGKSVVVVGHAASMMGRGLGQWIDAHDIVVRISMDFASEDLAADRGRKRTVWSCANASPHQAEWNRRQRPRRFSVWPWHRLHGGALPEIRRDLVWIGDSPVYELRNRMGNVIPTQGSILVYFFMTRVNYALLSVAGFDFYRTPAYHRKESCCLGRVTVRAQTGRYDNGGHHGAVEEAVMMPLIKKGRNVQFTA